MNKTVFIVIIVVILGVGGYFAYNKWVKKNTQDTKTQETIATSTPTTSPTQTKTDDNLSQSKTFKNNDLGVELSYDNMWTYIDLGGDKNVTEPLVRENVAYFQIAEEGAEDTLANVKLLRFVLEEDALIQSPDDWYEYIKNKVDEYISNEVLSANYEPQEIKIVENIDGKYTIEETYIEQDTYQGKDIYIFNGSDFYQFVTKIKLDLLDKYQESVDRIINSIKISQ